MGADCPICQSLPEREWAKVLVVLHTFCAGQAGSTPMSYVIPIVVGMLMVSIGMSLRLRELASTVRRLTWLGWLRLLLATFVFPAALALGLGRLFHLELGALAGVFLVGVAPGAPLLTRNLARKGFDMHLAATYQLWAALMVPIMIPLLVFFGGLLYNRTIWIPPRMLLLQIAEKQLLPLAMGMVLARFAPGFSKRAQPPLNVLGNVLMTLFIVLALFKLGPELRAITPMLPVVCLLLALGCMLAVWVMRLDDPVVVETFAISNTNRHVGLALLLSGQYVHAVRAIPAIACYAVAAALVMIVYARWSRRGGRRAAQGAAAGEGLISG
jgi:bile acid:Na+ symporter, BASS family